jgi:hypothetical protein
MVETAGRVERVPAPASPTATSTWSEYRLAVASSGLADIGCQAADCPANDGRPDSPFGHCPTPAQRAQLGGKRAFPPCHWRRSARKDRHFLPMSEIRRARARRLQASRTRLHCGRSCGTAAECARLARFSMSFSGPQPACQPPPRAQPTPTARLQPFPAGPTAGTAAVRVQEAVPGGRAAEAAAPKVRAALRVRENPRRICRRK